MIEGCQRRGDHGGVLNCGRVPADDGPRIAVHHEGHVRRTPTTLGIGEVGDAFAVRRGGGEVVIKQIRCSTGIRARDRGAVPATPQP